MTERDVQQTLQQLCDRVENIEDEHDSLARLPEALAELKGQLNTLQTLVLDKLDGVGVSVNKAASTKTALEFAAVVIIPIIVAIIGGYFALRAGLASHPPPSK